MTQKLSKGEYLFVECEKHGINIVKNPLPDNFKGLYYADDETEPIITIDPCVNTETEACCVLAEELGHYYTSSGNLITDKSVKNTAVRQQETRARRWAYEKLVPLDKLIEAYESGVRNRHELALYLDVIEEFLEGALKYYEEKYGLYYTLDNYIIYFEPLGICKMFE